MLKGVSLVSNSNQKSSLVNSPSFKTDQRLYFTDEPANEAKPKCKIFEYKKLYYYATFLTYRTVYKEIYTNQSLLITTTTKKNILHCSSHQTSATSVVDELLHEEVHIEDGHKVSDRGRRRDCCVSHRYSEGERLVCPPRGREVCSKGLVIVERKPIFCKQCPYLRYARRKSRGGLELRHMVRVQLEADIQLGVVSE